MYCVLVRKFGEFKCVAYGFSLEETGEFLSTLPPSDEVDVAVLPVEVFRSLSSRTRRELGIDEVPSWIEPFLSRLA